MHRKLSDLVLEGSKLRPQTRGVFFGAVVGKGLCSCALGAAIEAATGIADEHIGTEQALTILAAETGLPLLTEIDERSPLGEMGNLAGVIALMNDGHCNTREEIAEWLKGKGY
jgi:hypothetical protein